MRILLWHGYLLGGTGSNVYTRALAREWSRAGHDVTVVCQERHPERYDLGGARGRRAASCPDGLLPVFVLDRLRGARGAAAAGLHAARSATRTSRRTRRRCARCCRPTSSSRTTCCSAAPVGAASGRRATPSRRTARSSSTRCAGGPSCERWGRESLARRDAVFVGSAHIRERARGRRRPRRPRARGAAGRRRRRVRARGPRDDALAALLEEARRDRRIPATATSGIPDAGNAERFARVLRARASRRSSTSAS